MGKPCSIPAFGKPTAKTHNPDKDDITHENDRAFRGHELGKHGCLLPLTERGSESGQRRAELRAAEGQTLAAHLLDQSEADLHGIDVTRMLRRLIQAVPREELADRF